MLRERAVDDLLEDGALVLEVKVEGAARDPGGGHDVVDLGVVVAAPREDVASVVQNLLPTLDLTHAIRTGQISMPSELTRVSVGARRPDGRRRTFPRAPVRDTTFGLTRESSSWEAHRWE